MIDTHTGVLQGIRGFGTAKWLSPLKEQGALQKTNDIKKQAQECWKLSGALEKPTGITIKGTIWWNLHRGTERYQGHWRSQMISLLKEQWAVQKSNNIIDTCIGVLQQQGIRGIGTMSITEDKQYYETCTGVLKGIQGIAQAKWHHHWRNNEHYRRWQYHETCTGLLKGTRGIPKVNGITTERTTSKQKTNNMMKLAQGCCKVSRHWRSQIASPLKEQ